MADNHEDLLAADRLLAAYQSGALTLNELFIRLGTLISPENVSLVLPRLPLRLLNPLRDWASQQLPEFSQLKMAEGHLLGSGVSKGDVTLLAKHLTLSIPLMVDWLRKSGLAAEASPRASVIEGGHQALAVRVAIYTFVQDVMRKCPREFYKLGKSPFFDESYDENFTSVPSFSAALAALESLTIFQQHYGGAAAKGLILEFVYRLLDSLPQPDLTFSDAGFDKIWTAFESELRTPQWTHCGVAMLQNVECALDRVEIADGVWICQRTTQASGGRLDEEVLEWLKEDWMQGVFGTHVMLAEHRATKTSGQFYRYLDGFNPSVKLSRALLAARLLHGGDVGIGRMHFFRPALFPPRVPGHSTGGFNHWQPGEDYYLMESDIKGLRAQYSILEQFDRGPAASWQNVAFALRCFAGTYPRQGVFAEDHLMAALLALEALVSRENEALAIGLGRAAVILGRDQLEQERMLGEVDRYHAVRNAIVHGRRLGDDAANLLRDLAPMRELLRDLLKTILLIAVQTPSATSDDLLARLDSSSPERGKMSELEHPTVFEQLRAATQRPPLDVQS